MFTGEKEQSDRHQTPGWSPLTRHVLSAGRGDGTGVDPGVSAFRTERPSWLGLGSQRHVHSPQTPQAGALARQRLLQELE